MALIVAGRFTTFDQANLVARRLYDRAFRPGDVSVFFLNPAGQHATYPIGGDVAADAAAKPAGKGAAQGVVVGALGGLVFGVVLYVVLWPFWVVPLVAGMAGAYLGAFMGALQRMRGREDVSREQAQVRDAGVMLATHVSETTADTALEALRDAGAESIERADGVWENGEWQDFDPLQRPVPPDTMRATPRESTVGMAANDARTDAEKRPRRTDWL